MKQKKYIWAAITMMIGCVDNNQPTPSLEGNHPDIMISDAAVVTGTEQAPNQYVCYCRALVPSVCLTGCGTVGTGTHTTSDGNWCEIETRGVSVCFPPNLNPSSQEHIDAVHTPSYQELEQDCEGRVETLLQEELKYIYFGCLDGGECNIQYGCTALRIDNSILVNHNDRCNQECPWIPLRKSETDNFPNVSTATYVEATDEVVCDGHTPQTTERVCGSL